MAKRKTPWRVFRNTLFHHGEARRAAG